MSSYIADLGEGLRNPAGKLTTKDVFAVVPSEVDNVLVENPVFDYTEYTRFGLWTSETIRSCTHRCQRGVRWRSG